jgi:flavin reductase
MSWIDQRPDDAMDGAFTAVGPDIVRTVEPAIFREAMSRLGAAVHVITTAGPGGKAGATATAVCSVSDAPPTLLMCLNRRSQTNPAVVENGVFCVNTLGDGGAEIADIFAGRTGVMAAIVSAAANGRRSPPVVRRWRAVVAFDCCIVEVGWSRATTCPSAREPSRLGPAASALSITTRAG